MRELLLLKLRNAIAAKEWLTARANYETAWFEEWKSDWAVPIAEVDIEIGGIISKLEAMKEGQE